MAAAVALVRQDADLRAVIHVGLPTYVDGRIDKIVENLADRQADADVRRAAHLREGLQPASSTVHKGRWRREVEDLPVGVQGRPARYRRCSSRASSRTGLLKVKHGIADKLVFSKIRARLGGRIRILVSGAAPLSKDIAEFFHAAGLTILEGYGLTETSAGAFVNLPEQLQVRHRRSRRWATSRYASPRTARSSCAASPVMRGYHNLPEETAELLHRRRLLQDRRHR